MGSLYKPKWKDKAGAVHVSRFWWVKYYRNGRAMRESSESEQEGEARKLLRLREGDVVRGVPVMPRSGRIKFSELITDLINDYKVNKKKSIAHLERRCTLHITPFFGESRAAGITTADIRRFILARQTAKASNGEINRELAAIKRAYNLAQQAGKLLVKPHIPMLQEHNVRTGFFEWDQFAAVRARLPVYLRPVVDFAYITGWRKSEVLSLQWRQVDLKAGTVRLEPGTTKNDEGRMFPFTAALRDVLEGQKVSTEALQTKQGGIIPWVFHRDGEPIKDLRTAWGTACTRAGAPGRLLHDFRRTAVRNLEKAGVPRSVAMKLTGHKTESVYRRYAIVSEGDLNEAAKRLDVIMGMNSGMNSGTNGKKAKNRGKLRPA